MYQTFYSSLQTESVSFKPILCPLGMSLTTIGDLLTDKFPSSRRVKLLHVYIAENKLHTTYCCARTRQLNNEKTRFRAIVFVFNDACCERGYSDVEQNTVVVLSLLPTIYFKYWIGRGHLLRSAVPPELFSPSLTAVLDPCYLTPHMTLLTMEPWRTCSEIFHEGW